MQSRQQHPETRLRSLYENSQRNRRVAKNSYRYGWPIDKERQALIANQIREQIQEAERDLRKLLEEVPTETDKEREFLEKFNANSPPQIARLIYEILEEPVRVRTDQGSPGAGKEALEGIIRSGSEIASQIASCLRKRKTFAKLEEAYISNLENCTLVRPSPHVTAQVGGRWSYKEPALQTVPGAIKPMFVAHPGNWMICCDLAGAEYRTMALQAGCVGMLNAFAADRDLHTETGGVLFGIKPSEVSGPQRKIAKGVGLGFHYSVLNFEGAAAGLYGQVGHLAKGLTFELVLGALKRLAAARPEIMAFKEEIWRKAQELDYVETPLSKRRRYFYGEPKDTEAFNFPQQAMIADIVDWGIQEIDSRFQEGEGLLLQRHDELVISGPDPVRLCQLLWDHFRREVTLAGHSVMFEIEYKLSKRWGEGIDLVPKENGSRFLGACSCGFKAEWGTLESGVLGVTNHWEERHGA